MVLFALEGKPFPYNAPYLSEALSIHIIMQGSYSHLPCHPLLSRLVDSQSMAVLVECFPHCPLARTDFVLEIC
ncbi:hypothetical protein XELAEV_18021635mg [Xenopus laevis]|uniref:Uncharacterized protein n=1 Tax=Xenopus laevis TaxID=8355 RepID=A0A974HRK4_XENLA|nr:hypothetical protein XELAEV_18021635mg [Xenopus laevis]